jgi:hypothetical protein
MLRLRRGDRLQDRGVRAATSMIGSKRRRYSRRTRARDLIRDACPPLPALRLAERMPAESHTMKPGSIMKASSPYPGPKTVHRALSLLKAFTDEHHTWTLTELAAHVIAHASRLSRKPPWTDLEASGRPADRPHRRRSPEPPQDPRGHRPETRGTRSPQRLRCGTAPLDLTRPVR